MTPLSRLRRRGAHMTARGQRRTAWIFNQYALAGDSGALTRHFDMAVELASEFDVLVFAAGFNHYTRREERLKRHQLYRIDQIDGVKFVWVRTTPYQSNGLGRFLNMVSYFVAVMVVQTKYARPEVVLGSSVHPLAGLAGYLVGKLRGARFSFEVRDLWPQALIDLGTISENGVPARAMRALKRFLYRHASTVVTVMPDSIDHIMSAGVDRDRIFVIPNSSKPLAAATDGALGENAEISYPDDRRLQGTR